MTARQDQQLGYALDSQWYGIGEFTGYMREPLRKLTLEDVNAAIKRHLTARDLSVAIITKDAGGLKQALASDAFSQEEVHEFEDHFLQRGPHCRDRDRDEADARRPGQPPG